MTWDWDVKLNYYHFKQYKWTSIKKNTKNNNCKKLFVCMNTYSLVELLAHMIELCLPDPLHDEKR